MKLQRTLEPEVMDTVDEAIAYDEMNHDCVNKLFVDDLLAQVAVDKLELAVEEHEMLDLGTGTALIPIELCRRSGGYRVLGVDMAVSMLDLARNNVEVASLGMQIQLDRVDAKQLAYHDDRFMVVMSNSIIHHLPEPLFAIRESARVAALGGLLFFRDLMRPNTISELDALVEAYAGDEPSHARQLFRDSLHAALDLDEIRKIVVAAGFDSLSVRATSDRHWTWIATKTKD